MKAYQLLDSPDKWRQFYPSDGKQSGTCALIAICDCYKTSEEQGAACARLRKVIGEVGIMSWNDEPGRTFEEVRGALIKADV